MIIFFISVTSHALYPSPPVTNCHTFSDPLPLERDVLYVRPLNSPSDQEPINRGAPDPGQAEKNNLEKDLGEIENWHRLGRCLRSIGRPFQVVGPTTEKERVCIVAERANGITSYRTWTEDRSVRRPAQEEREGGRARADKRAPSVTSTATPGTQPGASIPPETMMHFPPVSDFPPIFEKF